MKEIMILALWEDTNRKADIESYLGEYQALILAIDKMPGETSDHTDRLMDMMMGQLF